MASVGVSVPTCCTPCTGVETVNIPGVKGDAGAAGLNGEDGISAFTYLTAGFTMPAMQGGDSTVTVNVANSTWMSAGMLLFVEGAGYMEVVSVPSTTSVTLDNKQNATTGTYAVNSAPGTVVAAGSKLVSAGLQGPAGVAGSGNTLVCADDGKTYQQVLHLVDGYITASWVEVI